MKDKLGWAVKGESFADGSRLEDWQKVFQSDRWQWQYDTHELSFGIYTYDGQFWKLYQARSVLPGDAHYRYDFGGVACRAVEVEYRRTARSPHSSMLKAEGELEWIRTYEFDPDIHRVVRAGERSSKYGEPYEHREVA